MQNPKPTQTIAIWFVTWFVLLFIISLPFAYHSLPDIGKLTSPFFEGMAGWVGTHVLGVELPASLQFASDSKSLYIHTAWLVVISILMAAGSFLQDKKGKYSLRIRYWSHVCISYYLALQLFKYGFDKLFKHQFYLPEPNILFTPLGQLSPDILFWSSMGSSYSYSVFAGLLEIIPAVLLLFARTRMLGALIAIPVMINVLMINIGFDISVKLYSAFLLFLGFVIISPNVKKLYDFLILNKQVQANQWRPPIHSKKEVFLHSLAKSLLIGIILFESLCMYFQTNNFNDDLAARPFLHGAYEVLVHKINDEMIPPLLTDRRRLKRIFIHRKGYLITQSMTDNMRDYQLRYNLADKKLIAEGYDHSLHEFAFRYEESDSTLSLTTITASDTLEIIAKQIDLNKLPLLEHKIHWTLDDY